MDNDKVLKAARFFESPIRMIWINRDRRMLFTHEDVRDRNRAWIEAKLLEDVPEDEFRFHSNRKLSLDTCMDILKELALPDSVIPVNPPDWI